MRRTVDGAFLVAAADAVVLPSLVRFIPLPIHDTTAVGAEQQTGEQTCLSATVEPPAVPDSNQTTELYSKIAAQVI